MHGTLKKNPAEWQSYDHRAPMHSLVDDARSLAACFQLSPMRTAHADRSSAYSTDPIANECVPSAFQCKGIDIVRVVVVLRVVVLAFVPH